MSPRVSVSYLNVNPEIRPFVSQIKCITAVPGKRPFRPKTHLPTFSQYIKVSLDDPVTLHYGNGKKQIEPIVSFAGGNEDPYQKTFPKKGGRFIGIDSNVFGLSPLFGVPAKEMTNLTVSFEELVGKDAPELYEQLCEAKNDRQRIEVVETFLAKRIERTSRPPASVEQTLRALYESHGTKEIKDIAAELGCTVQNLNKLFGRWVGFSPKAVSRHFRLNRVIEFARKGGGPLHWTDLAVRGGYFDQPHMNHEFNDIIGITPSDFIAEDLKGTQMGLLPKALHQA